MANPELEAKWVLVTELLSNARETLREQSDTYSPSVLEALSAFEHYLEHNELELALDAIAEAGQLTTPRARFWQSLIQAAEKMDLGEKAKEFQFLFVQAGARGITR